MKKIMRGIKTGIILGLVFSLIFGSFNAWVPSVYANDFIQEESEFGTIYYFDDDDSSGIQSRLAPWDYVDIAMSGISWGTLVKNPSLGNFGWAVLDTAAILPGLPSSAYFRQGGKILIKQSGLKNFAKTSKGKKLIQANLVTVGRSYLSKKETSKALTLARKYKLNQSQYTSHIVKRHAWSSKVPNKSRFVKNANIKSLIDSTVKNSSTLMKNTDGRDGYIFRKTFSKPVGVDSKGKNLYRVRVVLDSKGNVITAFPD